jgi:hypothetical protein
VRGELVAFHTFHGARWSDWARALVLMAKVADAIDPETRVEVHLGERVASAHPRCAYCHEDLGTDGVEKCGRCGTALHAACWEELGRCPVLGCEGSRGARERALQR